MPARRRIEVLAGLCHRCAQQPLAARPSAVATEESSTNAAARQDVLASRGQSVS